MSASPIGGIWRKAMKPNGTDGGTRRQVHLPGRPTSRPQADTPKGNEPSQRMLRPRIPMFLMQSAASRPRASICVLSACICVPSYCKAYYKRCVPGISLSQAGQESGSLVAAEGCIRPFVWFVVKELRHYRNQNGRSGILLQMDDEQQ